MIMNPIKDFLKPKYVVGLQVKEGFVGAVQLYVGLKGPEIDKAVIREAAGPEGIQEELKRLFKEEGFKKEMIVTSLPSSKAFIREISLPISQPKKVEKVIKYQMEPYLPCPVEEVLVDFLHPGKNGNILTFGVEKRILAEHLALLAGAGIEPDAVTLDDIGLFSLYLYKHGGESEDPVALVNQDGETLVLQIIYKKRLDFIRILPNDVDQLADTFRFYRMKRPDLSVAEIYLAGDGTSEAHRKAQDLESKTSVKTMVWRPFDEMRDRLDKTISLLQPKLGVPLGLAIGAMYPPEKPLDLRREEFIPKTYFNLRKMFLFMGAGLVLTGSRPRSGRCLQKRFRTRRSESSGARKWPSWNKRSQKKWASTRVWRKRQGEKRSWRFSCPFPGSSPKTRRYKLKTPLWRARTFAWTAARRPSRRWTG